MSTEIVYEEMKAKLSNVVPDVELFYKAELVEEINRLKKEKNAVILGHNYMEPALFHTIPDYTGDSLFLSRKAAETDRSISYLVNEAVRLSLCEELEDLAAFEERAEEPNLPFEDVLKELSRSVQI